MGVLISKIFDDYAGEPILIVGGGPSAGDDLPKLLADGFTPSCVISANDHGFKQHYYSVDFAVSCDRNHMERKDVNGRGIPMDEILRPYGKPLINRHSTADYRLPDWDFAGNSGHTAICVAVALGGNPVVATGIDMWRSGRNYFHIGEQEQRRMRHENLMGSKHGVGQRAMKQAEELKKWVRGANVRPVSGPLLTSFKPYIFGEDNFEPATACAYRKKHRGETVFIMRAESRATLNITERVRAGSEVAMSFGEREKLKTHFTFVRTA